MKYSIIIKKSLSYPFYYIHKVKALFENNKSIIILMYHRIIQKSISRVLLQEGMYVNPDTFHQQIKFLKENFAIISLEECFQKIKKNTYGNEKKQLCCITFDDGWKDFYDNAFEILKSQDACATVFLPTDYIGTKKRYWTDHLAKIISGIKQDEKIIKNDNSNNIINGIENLRGSIAERYEGSIRILKNLPMHEIDNVLDELGERFNVYPGSEDRSFVSWEEVKEMHESGLVNFGSHASSHRILTTISEEEVMEELLQSKNKLIEEDVVSKSFVPFAYPNGNHTDRIARMVEAAGYSIAVTTNRGWNCLTDDNIDRYKLKRVGIHQDMASTDTMFACRIHGLF